MPRKMSAGRGDERSKCVRGKNINGEQVWKGKDKRREVKEIVGGREE